MSNVIPVLRSLMLFSVLAQLTPARGHDLAIVIQPHKPVVALGEPVLVSATITNRGSEPVSLVHHNAPTLFHSSRCAVELRLGADPQHLSGWRDDLRPRKETTPIEVPPGERISVDLVMLFNSRDGFFVTEAGKYWIQGRVVIAPSPYVEVLSPPVPIEIREPSPSDRPAWEWVKAHQEEYGRLVQVPWEAKLSDEFLQEAGRRCETSQSTYSEYLGLFLSRAYREGPKKDAELSARFAEIAKARASSQKIRTEADKILSKSEPKASP